MNKFGTTLVAGVFALTAAATASAAQIRFDTLQSGFYNATGGSNVDYNNTFDGDSAPTTVTWGTGGTSGYTYIDRTTPLFLSTPDTPFVLGQFTHYNEAINAGTGISSVEFSVHGEYTLLNDLNQEVTTGSKTFSFQIDHWETPNEARPCADSGSNGSGVNRNGCADRVTITTLESTDTFSFGGSLYTLTILGFLDRNDVFSPEFWSKEDGKNKRWLVAEFTTLSAVPLPPAALLFLSGLAGMFGVSRKKKTMLSA